jgi:hypothetical protein
MKDENRARTVWQKQQSDDLASTQARHFDPQNREGMATERRINKIHEPDPQTYAI